MLAHLHSCGFCVLKYLLAGHIRHDTFVHNALIRRLRRIDTHDVRNIAGGNIG